MYNKFALYIYVYVFNKEKRADLIQLQRPHNITEITSQV